MLQLLIIRNYSRRIIIGFLHVNCIFIRFFVTGPDPTRPTQDGDFFDPTPIQPDPTRSLGGPDPVELCSGSRILPLNSLGDSTLKWSAVLVALFVFEKFCVSLTKTFPICSLRVVLYRFCTGTNTEHDWKCRTWKRGTKCQGCKMQNLEMWTLMSGVENVGTENAGHAENQDRKVKDQRPEADYLI